MYRPPGRLRVAVVLLMAALIGCAPTQPFFLRESGDLSTYLDKQTKIEYPDSKEGHFEEAVMSRDPITLSNPEIDELWDLTLQECVHIALANTKTIRGSRAPRAQTGQLFANYQEGDLTDQGSQNITIYDQAIQETNVPGIVPGSGNVNSGLGRNFQLSNIGDSGPTGVEAALSNFDAHLQMFGTQGGGRSTLFSSSERPANIVPSFATGFLPTVQQSDGTGVQSRIVKNLASGGDVQINSQTDHEVSNSFGGSRALNSFWTQQIEIGVTQPLLRGAGTQLNRTPVVVAAINGHRSAATVETALQKMLDNIEVRYWDLHRSYRDLETAKIARDTTQIAWRFIYERFRAGTDPAQSEAQAREQYFTFRGAVEQALRDLHNNENELRLLMGLSPADGRVIRPVDEPTLARVTFDWNSILAEALVKRPELRNQRWQIKTQELQLIAYRNQLLPQLDVGAFYRWLGRGDQLITANRRDLDFPAVGSTAWDSLLSGDFQEMGVQMEFDYAIGNRLALSGVRNYQLKLARSKAQLEDMELDVTHSLVRGLRNMDANYTLAQSQFNRWVAADAEVTATQAVVEQGIGQGVANINQWLDAIRRRGQAQQAYYQSICEYNKSIADLHMRKGSILEYNGISFEEGPWPAKAYWDATGRARERDAGLYMDYGVTRPAVVTRGELPSHLPAAGSPIEELPAAEPTPAEKSEDLPKAKPAEETPAPESPEGEQPEASEDAPATSAIPRTTPRLARRQAAAQSDAFWAAGWEKGSKAAGKVKTAAHVEE